LPVVDARAHSSRPAFSTAHAFFFVLSSTWRSRFTKPDDPRIVDYRQLKERHLSAAGNRFVAESERVVRRLLASDLRVCSVLVTPPRLAAMAAELDAETPLPGLRRQPGRDRRHRRLSCASRLPGDRRAPGAAAGPDDARLVVAVEDLVDVDNLGSVVRNRGRVRRGGAAAVAARGGFPSTARRSASRSAASSRYR